MMNFITIKSVRDKLTFPNNIQIQFSQNKFFRKNNRARRSTPNTHTNIYYNHNYYSHTYKGRMYNLEKNRHFEEKYTPNSTMPIQQKTYREKLIVSNDKYNKCYSGISTLNIAGTLISLK